MNYRSRRLGSRERLIHYIQPKPSREQEDDGLMNSTQGSIGILGSLLATSVGVGSIFVSASQVEKTLYKFCKKLFIHTGVAQFPYQFFGSATALKIGNRHLLFCNGHQIDQFDPESVSFLHAISNHTISASRKIWPNITEENKDTDWIDTRAFEYPVEKYDIPNLSSDFFSIRRGENVWPINFHKTFFIFGYPTERQRVDYEIPHVHGSAAYVHGEYAGPSNSPHVHRIKMKRNEVFDADGMSGGPVFYLGTTGIGEYFAGFAGMIVRGGAKSDFLHFIDAEFILKMFDA